MEEGLDEGSCGGVGSGFPDGQSVEQISGSLRLGGSAVEDDTAKP